MLIAIILVAARGFCSASSSATFHMWNLVPMGAIAAHAGGQAAAAVGMAGTSCGDGSL